MKRSRQLFLIALGSILALATAAVVGLIMAGPSIQRSFFYPRPRNLPPVVRQTTEQLLARLKTVLETNAPSVASGLQPGLSEARITELETLGKFRLSEDLRALYRWHNGIRTNSTVGLLPMARFTPLDEIVSEQALLEQQLASLSAFQRTAYATFAGHRNSWVAILSDGAGDGYYYDPQRTDDSGAFFYNLAEDSYYVWFPSFRNFLAGVIEGYETGAIKMTADGKDLNEDFARTQGIWERFGKRSGTD